MKILIFVAFALALSNIVAADECIFDPVAVCARRDFSRNFHQYVANPCNCTEFYQCEKGRSGISVHKQACLNPCLCFSDDTWSCSIRVSTCPTEAPITELIGPDDTGLCFRIGNGPDGEYVQPYKEASGSDRYIYYIWFAVGIEVKQRCPAGTYFDFDQCQCISCVVDIPCAGSSENVFCLGFEGDGAEKGIYFDVNEESCSEVSGAGTSGTVLQLDGQSCNVEVPYFQNNEFSQFTFCGRFNRFSSGGGGEQGLIFNGAGPQFECYPGSIYVISTDPHHVKAGIVTDSGTYEINHSHPVGPDAFYSFCLRYNGNTLDFILDGVKESISASGVTLRTKCNLLIGESYDGSGLSHFFNGYLDDICFYNAAINLNSER